MKTTKLEISKVDGGIRLHVGELYIGCLIAPAEDIARIVQALQLGSGVVSGVDLVVVSTERTEPNKKTAGPGVQQAGMLQSMVGDVVDQMARIAALEPEQVSGQPPFDVGANLQLLRHIITSRSARRMNGVGSTVDNRPVYSQIASCNDNQESEPPF
jgi:hypothetical protein